jgi:ammonium transporter, Amt family
MIGVRENSEYVSNEFSIESNSNIFLFTDGLIEVWNENKEEFGEEILVSLESLDLDSNLAKQKLFLSGLPYYDDMTLIRLKKI